ncbi:unnamed protein product [Caenorhabditis bovis]|uniref:Uncharacterized protein n=1 Tax=Caenorhabditis bovis TaxID=2654633 RepID=A0A8S1F817_9PELO|nr:unnamed protein product [Caenorhabditis bovis]
MESGTRWTKNYYVYNRSALEDSLCLCQYCVQYLCTVDLSRMKRHKYCVRFVNNRRSAMFYVNIDETSTDTSVWLNFPGETKLFRPHTSHALFQRFLHQNLF